MLPFIFVGQMDVNGVRTKSERTSQRTGAAGAARLMKAARGAGAAQSISFREGEGDKAVTSLSNINRY